MTVVRGRRIAALLNVALAGCVCGDADGPGVGLDAGSGTDAAAVSATDATSVRLEAGPVVDDYTDSGPPGIDGGPACGAVPMVQLEAEGFDSAEDPIWTAGCTFSPSTVLRDQASLDAHLAAYCASCIPAGYPCPSAPVVDFSTSMVLFAAGMTADFVAWARISEVLDCVSEIQVRFSAGSWTPLETTDYGWDSVIVETTDAPVQFIRVY